MERELEGEQKYSGEQKNFDKADTKSKKQTKKRAKNRRQQQTEFIRYLYCFFCFWIVGREGCADCLLHLLLDLFGGSTVVFCNGVKNFVEVHHNPACALSDGKQSLSIPQFKEVFTRLNALIDILHLEKRATMSCLE